jgi:hypothetical protein
VEKEKRIKTPDSIVELEKRLDEATEKLGSILHKNLENPLSQSEERQKRSLKAEIDRLQGAIALEYSLYREN